MKHEDLIRRIRSLLEVAKPGSGATEPERDTAKRLAKSLMDAAGLNERDIPERQIETPKPPPPPPQYVVVFQFGGGIGGFGGCSVNSSTNTGTTSESFWGY